MRIIWPARNFQSTLNKIMKDTINWDKNIDKMLKEQTPFICDYILFNYGNEQLRREAKSNYPVVRDDESIKKIYGAYSYELINILGIDEDNPQKSEKYIVNEGIRKFVSDTYNKAKEVIDAHPDKKLAEVAVLSDYHFLSNQVNYKNETNLEKFITNNFTGADVISDVLLNIRDHSMTTGEGGDIYKHFQKDIDKLVNLEDYINPEAHCDEYYYAVNEAVHKILQNIYDKNKKDIIKNPEKKLKDILGKTNIFARFLN